MPAFALEAAATVILLYFLLASEHWLVSRTVEAVPRRRTRAGPVRSSAQAAPTKSHNEFTPIRRSCATCWQTALRNAESGPYHARHQQCR
jgi:hypothetical protein